MAVLNAVKREIVAKIVYYGPGLSGKTANLQKIHETMPSQNVGELTSLATESDRTLFFDFVPIQLGSIAGLNTRFQLFTVPGQVFYNQTRRTVLENADGVVFVADSQPEQLENNIESLKNLEENLAFYGKKLNDIPFVLQFNKQDLPGCMSEAELNKSLNRFGAASLRSSCMGEGFGVMETLAKVSTMVLSYLREQMTRKGGAPSGIKRTYSKEGVSDEAVVRNLLEDIAASGAAQEAKGAGNGGPTRPLVSRVSSPGVPAVTSPPRSPSPTSPMAGPVPASPVGAGPTLSAEDLLSDLEPAAPRTPAAPAAPPPKSNPRISSPPGPAATLKPGPPPPPPPARLSSSPPPPTPPSAGTGTPAGLRVAAKPAANVSERERDRGRKTAEELLESLEEQERSESGPAVVQESSGSFGSLWDDEDRKPAPTPPPKASLRPSAPPPPPPARANPVAGWDEDEPGQKTSLARVSDLEKSPGNGGTEPRGAPPLPPVGAAPRELSVASLEPLGVSGDVFNFQVTLADGGREVPVKLAVRLGDLPAGTRKSGGGGLLLAVIDLLLVIMIAAYLIAGRLALAP